MLACSSQPKITRLNNGKPIISPTSNWWESGVTFNPAVSYVERSPKNDPIIRKLIGNGNLDETRIKDGIVVAYYRARPSQETDPKRPFSRSFSGVAVFTPELQLLYRHNSLIISPSDDVGMYDYVGIEDGRLHHFDGTFYYLYCGVGIADNPHPMWPVKTRLRMAKSHDLLTWQKLGPVNGNINTNECSNKNGVLFPEKIDGHYFMLHRPTLDNNYSKYAIALAMSNSIEDVWEDLGIIKSAAQIPALAKHIWVGAGAVPIALGNKRYLVIYHRGHVLQTGGKLYDLHAAIFNFNRFDINNPGLIIEKRLERILSPETLHECLSNNVDGVANVVFTCGSYEYNGDIYILYGGADCCTLAAKVNKNSLMETIENSLDFSLGKTA